MTTAAPLHYPLVGTWKDEWLGLRIAQSSSGKAPLGRIFQAAASQHESFLGHRYRFVKNPRSAAKDMVYVLLNVDWTAFTLSILGFSVSVTCVFATAFHFVCRDTDTFENAFNLSYQSFTTIGFGILYPRNTCANIVLSLEAFVAAIVIATLSGLVFVRFSRPHSTAVFSSQCVVQPYGHDLALVIRVANATRSHDLQHDAILEASFHMNLMRIERTSPTNSTLVLRRYELHMLQSSFLAFRKDIQLVHVIDAASPLYGLTPELCALSDMALQVDLVGIEATSQSTLQDQMLYTAEQFEWGAKFRDMFHIDQDDGELVMDFRQLSATEPLSTTPPMHILPLTRERGKFHQAVYARQFSMADVVTQSMGTVEEGDLRASALSAASRQSHEAVSTEHHMFGKRRDHPMQDMLTQSLLDDDRSSVRSSRVYRSSLSTGLDVDNLPFFDRIVPRHHNVPYSFHTFYSDTLKTSWVKILSVSVIGFTLVNFVFAGIYSIGRNGIYASPDVQANNSDFNLCYFFSVHTLSTVGYGTIGPKPGSVWENLWVIVESIFGIVITTIFTGIAWSKFSRPRAHIKFSDKVVITTIQDQRVLLLRALNLRTHGDISGNAFRLGVSEKDKRTGLRQVHEVDLVNATFP
ncbi:hypothetical protein As57867_016572, partial [Aphanomyces stellatus]